jgi:osmotically-inducible protein OsmY
MKKNFIIFLLGLVIGSGSYWTFRDGPLATKVRENRFVQKVSEAFDERATSKLKDEMEKEGKIVVNKPASSNIADLDDGKLNDLVKAKIAAEPSLSDASIKPEAKSGEVTLRGTANSYDQVARAIRVSLECGATKSVVSTVEVKAK